jgi:hypothetical protein
METKNMAEKTAEQIRDEFLSHIAALVRYWGGTLQSVDRDPVKSLQDRLDGLAFSILVMLDGGSAGLQGGLPAFIVVP